MMGPALLLYLSAWALLALLRALTVRRGWAWQWRGGPRNGRKLEFTGWALVLEWRLPGIQRSRSAVLPLARRSTSGGRSRRPRSLSDASAGEWEGEGDGLGSKDGPTLPVVLFWVGQATMVLFLAYNALATLRDSGFGATAAAGAAAAHARGGVGDGGLSHRRLTALAQDESGARGFHVASRLRPMAFLLPSSSPSSNNNEGTADWRYVWWAALLALAAHEYGHACAARNEGVPVQHAGVYLALLLPGAYVLIPDSIKSVGPWARLRVLVAGVAANAALCGLLALLLLLNLPAQLITTPDPGGGAVLRALPSQSPLRAAMAPGDGIAALQDVSVSEGTAELLALLRAQAETTRARSVALVLAAATAAEASEAPDLAPPSLAALNATVTRLIADARLPELEAAGLLPPEAFCTHLDLTEGEDEEGRPVPWCCAFDALVGRGHASASSYAYGGITRTSCFAYLPVGEDAERERLHLTCLPARELALHSHVVGLGLGLGAAGSKAARGDRGRPYCFRPVSVPPNVMLKITLAHGRVVTFEGTVDDVANAAVAAGLADTRPRAWVRALLPERWAMALDAVLLQGLAALMDVSFSLGALNLVPLYQLDGAHALHEGVRLLAAAKRRAQPGSQGGLVTWYRRGVLAVGCLFALNVLLACLSAAEQAGLWA